MGAKINQKCLLWVHREHSSFAKPVSVGIVTLYKLHAKYNLILLSATALATCLATILAVARYVTLWNVPCIADLSRHNVAKTLNIARQVARNISQCNSAFRASIICYYQGVFNQGWRISFQIKKL